MSFNLFSPELTLESSHLPSTFSALDVVSSFNSSGVWDTTDTEDAILSQAFLLFNN